jgi:hypothetical protein
MDAKLARPPSPASTPPAKVLILQETEDKPWPESAPLKQPITQLRIRSRKWFSRLSGGKISVFLHEAGKNSHHHAAEADKRSTGTNRKMCCKLLTGFVFLLPAAFAAEELRLKNRMIFPVESDAQVLVLNAATEAPRRLTGQRQHWLVQFPVQLQSAEPTLDLPMAEWQRRGAVFLSSVPVNGYIVSIPDTFTWDALVYTYASPIAADDKVSPLLIASIADSEPEKLLLIAHFHADVERWEADGILDAEGIAPIPHPSLEVFDRLIEITPAQLHALKLWDEVEYLFPAPVAMKDGELYLTCAGSVANGFEIAMLAAAVGDGWDGPGRGRAALTFSLGPLSSRLDSAQVRSELRRALDEWSRNAAVTFSETSNRSANRNIDILFATGAHGDPFPFQPGSSVLGHSFYPAPPNPETLAGDIHINDAYTWSVGGGTQWDVYSVLLHEVGHSLGIGHTDDPGSVMYPYYQRATTLKPIDINSIRQIYAALDEPAPAPVLSLTINNPTEGTRTSAASVNFNGGLVNAANPTRVEYANETSGARGTCLVNSSSTTWSCAAIPLQTGQNRVAIVAVSGARTSTQRRTIQRDSNEPVELRITSPALSSTTTSAAALTVQGTAAHTSGIASVRWATNRGRSGDLSGSSSGNMLNWSGTISLEFGSNEVTVTAVARTGITTTRNLTVTRTGAAPPAPAPGPPTEDRTSPRMTIQQPIGSYILTTASRLTFRGTATDNNAVTMVTWTNSAGDQSGSAATTSASTSTVNWNFEVNIAVGFNTIQVRAWDAAGNSTLYQTTVRRY